MVNCYTEVLVRSERWSSPFSLQSEQRLFDLNSRFIQNLQKNFSRSFKMLKNLFFMPLYSSSWCMLYVAVVAVRGYKRQHWRRSRADLQVGTQSSPFCSQLLKCHHLEFSQHYYNKQTSQPHRAARLISLTDSGYLFELFFVIFFSLMDLLYH